MTVNEGGMFNGQGKAYNGNGIWIGHRRQRVVGKSDFGSSNILKGFIYLDNSNTFSNPVTVKNSTTH